MNKKVMKRTPLRTTFVLNNQILPWTLRSSSSGNKPVSAEEHKVMIENQRLAKENAYLKSALNDVMDLNQQFIAANQELIAINTQALTQCDTMLDMFKDQRDSTSDRIAVIAAIAADTNNGANYADETVNGLQREITVGATGNAIATASLSTGSINANTSAPIDNSIVSVYDFNEDEENTENVMPLSLKPPQRHSKRIRSKRLL